MRHQTGPSRIRLAGSPRPTGAGIAYAELSVRGVYDMASWFGARKKLDETAADEALIRVCVVTRDPALIEEAHKDLLVGFLTRGAYEFESGHPDFQRCDVLLVDLRAAGVQGDPRDSLPFIEEIRKSVSHPPIVAL